MNFSEAFTRAVKDALPIVEEKGDLVSKYLLAFSELLEEASEKVDEATEALVKIVRETLDEPESPVDNERESKIDFIVNNALFEQNRNRERVSGFDDDQLDFLFEDITRATAMLREWGR